MSARFGNEATVGGIRFDQARGLGNTALGVDIGYFGFACAMTPSAFLSLASPLVRDARRPRYPELVRAIQAGAPIASPFLKLAREGDVVRVVAHEGRHRMCAILEAFGDIEVPVHLVPGWTRASGIDASLIERLRESMRSELGVDVPGPLFGDAFLRDTIVPVRTASFAP